MGWNWKANSYESSDPGGGGGPPPQSPPPPPQSDVVRFGTGLIDPNQNPVLGFFFGNDEKPGIFGTGQFKADPKAGTIGGSDTRQQQVSYGYGRAFGADPGAAFQGQQMALAGDLLAASRGQGPSVAQEQLRQGTQANLAATVAAANSTRGPGGAAQAGQLAARQAMAGQQMASDAGLLRAQEIAQARGQLAQVAGQGREQDMALEQQRQQIALQYIQMGLTEAQAAQQAAMDMERLTQQSYYKTADNSYRFVKDVAGAAGQIAGIGAKGG